MNQNDILTDRTLRRNEPLRLLRRGMNVALAAAVALSAPALLAAPAAKRGSRAVEKGMVAGARIRLRGPTESP